MQSVQKSFGYFFLQSAHFPIHILSSDTQACFVVVTLYNTVRFKVETSQKMPSARLHTYVVCPSRP